MRGNHAPPSARLPLPLSRVPRRSVAPEVRSNIMVGLADLCTRHPNVLEPWTALLYSPLQDPQAG